MTTVSSAAKEEAGTATAMAHKSTERLRGKANNSYSIVPINNPINNRVIN